MGASWEFRSIPVEQRMGEAEEFARRIGAAFRVGAGLDGVIRWTWETGRDGRCSISADGPDAQRWVQRVLLPAYPVGQWVPTLEPRRVRPPSPLSFAVAVPDAIGPFRSITEEPVSWVEPILGLLGGLPGGVRLGWELRPLRTSNASRTPPTDAELVRQPPGFRAGTPPLPRRSLADRMEERRLGPHWALSGTLSWTDGGAGPSDLERLARVVEAASRREGGSGLGFRPRVWLWRRRAPLVILSSGEVAALLPTPWARYVTSGSAVPNTARRLPIGRDSQGLPASIWIEPGQGRHLLVLGETGMGKSSLLVRLARQVASESSLVVFDPLGGTARSVMAALPPSVLERLLWVSPVHSPVGINALASLRPVPGASPWRAERACGDLVGALRRVRASRYADTPFWGPRIEELLTQAISAAAAIPGGTLLDAERLLAEPGRSPRGIPPEAQDRSRSSVTGCSTTLRRSMGRGGSSRRSPGARCSAGCSASGSRARRWRTGSALVGSRSSRGTPARWGSPPHGTSSPYSSR